MGFRDKISAAKDTATNTASGVKETVAERTDGAKKTVSEAKGAASIVASGAKGVVSEKTNEVTGRVAESLPKQLIDSSVVGDETDSRMPVSWLASVSYERFSFPTIHVRPAIQQYGSKTVDVAQEVHLGRTYRFGKAGLKYGKEYGDYVPVAGGFLPYIGLAAGVGVGVLDGTDVLSADKVTNFSSSLSDAIERVVQNDSQRISDSLVTGGVVFADSYLGKPEEESLEDLLEMDFDEFADK